VRKRKLAKMYQDFFSNLDTKHVEGSVSTLALTSVLEPKNASSNYWLNCVLLKDRASRDQFLEETNNAGIMTRPIWELMNRLPMFKNCQCGDLTNSEWLTDRVVNITSTVL
jgi:dTDP-4-amino-4,6-dideoxygalactose transaminase